MTHRLLAAATLMLVTTATAWAETEGVPNVKTPEPEKVETQMEETLDDIQNYSVEQKNQAMRVARHAIDDLNQQITLLQGDINSQWRDLSQDARLQKQEALTALKEQQAQLETYEYTGGAHGLPSVQYFHWDLAKQQSVKLGDLLVPGQQSAFWEKAREQHTAWLDEENLDQTFRDSWPFDKTDNVFFNDKGMVLQYNVYHIAPYAMGQPTLTIPYAELEGIVRGQYLPQQ